MNRTEYMLRLAAQKEFAYVSENVSVASILSSPTSSISDEKTLSPVPEENDIDNEKSSESPLPKNIIIHSNILMPHTSRTISSNESKLVTINDETDSQDKVKLPGFSTIRSEIASELENTKVNPTHSKTSKRFDVYEFIEESVPGSDSKDTTFREYSLESSGERNSAELASHFQTVPEDSLPYMQTNIQGDNIANPEFTSLTNVDFIKTPVIKSNSILEVASELENTDISSTHSKTSERFDGYEIFQKSAWEPGSDSKNTTFREHSQESSGESNLSGPTSHLKTVPEDSNLPYMQTNIQGDNIENLEFTSLTNVNFVKPPVSKSNSILEQDVYEGSHHFSVSAFGESDSKEDKTGFDDFEDFYSSGSDYIPSSYSTSTSSDIDEPEKFDLLEVKKTFSKRNPIGQLIKDSQIMAAKNKEVAPRVSEGNCNQYPEQDIPNYIFNHEPKTIPGINNKYVKNPAARERPTLCPICYDDVVTHFSRHLVRHHADHKDVKLLQSLKPGSSERLAMISAFRKQGYFHLNTEKDVMNPVRSSKDSSTKYFVCTSCLGYYSKKNLYKHVKICKSRPSDSKNSGRSCLSRSQTFMASARSKNQEFLRTSRIKKEVFDIMRADDISEEAKNDPLICLYGESLLAKHKRQQIATMVSNKVREMARMLITMKSMDGEISSFFDVLRPEMFGTLLSAAKIISGYDEINKSFRAPSLALHMGTNLKLICNVAFKIVIEKRKLPKINWEDRDKKKSEIKDLRKLIEGHWCNEISSLAMKTLKERQWEKPVQLPLTRDILLFQTYINDRASKAFEELKNQRNVIRNYKILTECVLVHTVMFNRKRVGDVQYLQIETYERDNQRIDQEAFSESLTTAEKILSKKFKRVVTGGKGSKPVPILFSPKFQKYIKCLLNIRRSSGVVPNSNPYLFANPYSENRWMAGTRVIRLLAGNSGAQQPKLLTSTKFRKHIATTLQLMTMESDELEQIAKFMGHTEKTHSEFYRLPQDIYQTAKVVKVLLLLEKGRGKEFRGKSLGEIELEKDIYYSSESEEDAIQNIRNKKLTKAKKRNAQGSDNEMSSEDLQESALHMEFNEKKCFGPKMPDMNTDKQLLEEGMRSNKIETIDEDSILGDGSNVAKEKKGRENKSKKIKISENDTDEEEEGETIKLSKKALKPIKGRVRWSKEEKELVHKYFVKHVKNKITPKKHECDEFIKKYGNLLVSKDWVKIKTFVYNCFKEK